MTDDTFEDVDWSETGGRLWWLGTARARAVMATAVGYIGLFIYDYVARGDRPTIPFLSWEASQLDWLFILALLALLFGLIWPLARNRRLTAAYWREFRQNRPAVLGLGFLIAIFLIGLIGPILTSPPELAVTRSYQPPVGFSVDASLPSSCVGAVIDGQCHGTMAHPFGTTQRGRDVLKYIVFGMRVSMQIGLIGALIVISIGTLVGTVSAYAGGMVDEVLMRYVDVQQTFPVFFLYLLINFLFDINLFLLILVFSLFSWGGIARLVRSEALQRSEEAYVRAADGAGASTAYIVRRHLIPNVSGTVITVATLTIPGLLLFEAGLSFLELGTGAFSWGEVIAAGRENLTQAWWVSTIPGFFLFFTILAFNYLGDALRDALDPREVLT
ncbi:MAG: ABC transporter permease [Salinirussus sp.]